MGSGINAAGRDLGIDGTEAQRAVKIASIAPEAKEAARAAERSPLQNGHMPNRLPAAPKNTAAAVNLAAVRLRPDEASTALSRSRVSIVADPPIGTTPWSLRG